MTTANKITIFRILLIPLFIFELLGYRSTGAEWQRWLALSAFGPGPGWGGPGFRPRRGCFVNRWGEVICPRRRYYY